jgi:CRP-like cAMP-binding protein
MGPSGNPSGEELRTILLFQGFGDDELARLGSLFTRAQVDPNSALFDVGERATELYLLTSGEVVLEGPGDDLFRLRPPALIGELGALTGLPRSTRATVSADAVVWSLRAKTIQELFASNQELGVRFLVNLLSVVADKVHRDQTRMSDMRQNIVRTQKQLKRMRELVLESAETPISGTIHDTLETLITHNRRVNYRVEPPPSLPVALRLGSGDSKVTDISRTHLSTVLTSAPPTVGTGLAGVLTLARTEIPISGRVHRVIGNKVTIELDLLIDEYVGALEGYLTRVQLLDVLV